MRKISLFAHRNRRPRSTGRWAVAGIVCFAAAIQLAGAGAASAAVPVVVTGHSASDSVSLKIATAACPAGTRVYGGGGDIVGGGAGVLLTGLVPATGATRDTFTVTAQEDIVGYSGSWSVYAYAICGTGLSNVSIHTGGTSVTTPTTAVATCPQGTAPVGLGAQIFNGQGAVVLNSMFADYRTTVGGKMGSTTARAIENTHPGGWGLTSYAVCATPPAGLTYRYANSSTIDSSNKSASLECPTGSRIVGIGGSATTLGSGQVHFDRIAPHGSSWTGADIESRESQAGFAKNWSSQIEAICTT